MSSRIERHTANVKKPKVLAKIVFSITILILLGGLCTSLYLKKSIVIEAPKVDLGNKVVVILPNGKEVYTYENLIVSEDGKLYYEGDRSRIDLTGGTIKVEEWE